VSTVPWQTLSGFGHEAWGNAMLNPKCFDDVSTPRYPRSIPPLPRYRPFIRPGSTLPGWSSRRPTRYTSEICMCPLFPGRPCRGLAMKHGVMPCLIPNALTTYLARHGRRKECLHSRYPRSIPPLPRYRPFIRPGSTLARKCRPRSDKWAISG
jgi:hypothetical protein